MGFSLDYSRSVVYCGCMRVISSIDLGNAVRERRKALGLTQSELAMYCNTGVRFISDLENGKATCEIQKTLTVLSMLALNVELVVRG